MVRLKLMALGDVGALALVVMLALAACGPTQASGAGKTATVGAPAPTVAATLPPTPSAQPCQATQLAGQFRAVSPATGNVTGEILVRNTSDTACAVQGNVDFYGIDAQGQRLAGGSMNQPESLAPVVLPPNTPVLPSGVEPTPGAYLVMFVMGAYRDDPTAPGLVCTAANEITPAKLVVAVGSIRVSATNYDAAGGHFPSMVGCHGKILGEGASLS